MFQYQREAEMESGLSRETISIKSDPGHATDIEG